MKHAILLLGVAATAGALLSVMLVGRGSSEDEAAKKAKAAEEAEAPMEVVEDLVSARLSDPEYAAEIDRLCEQRTKNLHAAAQAHRALVIAQANGASAEELTRLSNAWIRAGKDLKAGVEASKLLMSTKIQEQLEQNEKARRQKRRPAAN